MPHAQFPMPQFSLHRFTSAPEDKTSKSTVIFWFSLTLTFAAVYGLMVLQKAFGAEYIVQDDARQHVFWMQRFVDSQLFPNDLIADYFQTVAPAGYTGLYWLAAKLGIAPLLLSKLLPPILGIITTAYCFALTMQLLPVPVAGFISSLFLNHYLWMRDDLVSATAVAFVYPLFAAFLYYWTRRALLPACAALALLGLFYPQAVLISAGIIILELWRKQDYRFCLSCLAVAFSVMLLYALKSNGYGPVVTAAEARNLPEFLPGGEFKFFNKYPQDFWFTGQRSGIAPRFGSILPLVAGGLLPLLLLFNWSRSRLWSKVVAEDPPQTPPSKKGGKETPLFKGGLGGTSDWNIPFLSTSFDQNKFLASSPFPLLRRLENIGLLLEIILASLAMFFICHAMLFRLHLPSRYTEHSLRFVAAIAGGIALTVLIDAVASWSQKQRKPIVYYIFTVLVLGVVILEPTWLKRFPRTDYVIGKAAPAYEFFAAQPKDILVASLAAEANNIPLFSQRSIIVGSEGYPVPYHKKYYKEMRQRTVDSIAAHYSSDLEDLRRFTEGYSIDFWLVEEGAFTPDYITRDRWMMQYRDTANEAIANLQQGKTPALARASDRCTVLQSDRFAIIEAKCAIGLAAD
ncbi:MAG: hypothetical protein F6J93_03410 [Oscillatoria sp. SIO1A7]|nr:hypothetical protein [Oscillatoria sp. SIO1A7]